MLARDRSPVVAPVLVAGLALAIERIGPTR